MVEQYIITNLSVCHWNTVSKRLEEIFSQIFRSPLSQKTRIHIYEPLADPNGLTLERMVMPRDSRNIFVLLSAEGHSEYEYDRLLSRFNPGGSLSSVAHDDIILYTASFSLVEDKYRHVQNWSGILNNTLDMSGRQSRMTPATKFCTFLNREHRWQRQELFEELHRLDILDKMHVSYLSTPSETEYKTLYPKILDKARVSFVDGYNLEVGSAATYCVVAESSYENLGELESIEVPGISEKTYKTILSCQIPIFLSTAYTVYHYRMMGYDVFDDLVDHSYDLIEDPVKRIKAVATEIDRLGKYWTVGTDVELRGSLKDRFEKNLKLMEYYSHPRMELRPWYNHFSNMGLVQKQSSLQRLV